MNPNFQQADLEEEEGIEEVEEQDIDYDSIYGGLDVDINFEKSDSLKKDYSKVFGDVVKQGLKETLIGAGGAYGDLLELAGLQGGKISGQEDRNIQEYDVLTKLQDPTYEITPQDISDLESDEGPPSFYLPSSKDLRGINDTIGGPGEPETDPGKYAARSGKLYGAGLAFGQTNPIPAISAGVVGQGIEDLGGGPLLQGAGEILTILATQGKSGAALSSSKKQIQDKIDNLRKLGYTEQDITLAINSAHKNSNRARIASKGQKVEDAFEDFSKHSDDIVGDILTKEIPGIEQGIKNVHQMASDVYGQVAQEAASLTITNSKPFLDASKKVIDHLQNTLGKNPEAKEFIKRISEAAMDATQFPSADKFMNFYKELNSMGNWLGRNQKDRLITEVKNGIKDTFRAQGPKGKELASKFEKANQGIQKAYKAEEAFDLLQKASNVDGYDYKKMSKLFDKQENVDIFKGALGTQQTKNLELISKTGKEIKDFDKSWKKVNNFSIGTGADIIRGAVGSYYLYKGDWEGLAKVAATKIGSQGIKYLAQESLTNPKFQNLLIKGLHAIKSGSAQSMKSVNESMNKFLEEEGIDLD